MNIKKVLIVVISLIVIFIISVLISQKLVSTKDEVISDSENNNVTDIYQDVNNIVQTNTKDDNYIQINKDSTLANQILEFVPKTYQTYINKLNDEYMVYEAITRLSKDDSVEYKIIDGLNAYSYADVEAKLKEIYGENANVVKKEKYNAPIEYLSQSDSYVLYPYSLENTDNMMVIKSLEENSKTYKLTVYSVCVFVDVNSNDYNTLYLVTKDTMRKYLSLTSRNSEQIFSTYKKYEFNGGSLDTNDIVEKFKNDLPQIEFYLTKLDDRGTKYYVSNIIDIY